MVKKLDVKRIEESRHKAQSSNRREEEKQRIQDTIAQNRYSPEPSKALYGA